MMKIRQSILRLNLMGSYLVRLRRRDLIGGNIVVRMLMLVSRRDGLTVHSLFLKVSFSDVLLSLVFWS